MAENLKIRTEHVNPPIPIRTKDWSAWIDGREEDGPFGYGRTEQEAIADLQELLEE
jgi:hypothetical protein